MPKNNGKGAAPVVSTAGKAKLHGDNSDNLLFGDGGEDWLHGKLGNDSLGGGGGDDRIDGGGGNDALWGDDGDDLLRGGNGDDTLHGGAGNDEISGGAGTDLVVYDQSFFDLVINRLANGSIEVSDGTFTDILRGVERIQVAEGVIDLTGGNNAPFTRDDARTTDEDNVLTINAADLLSNDADFDGDTLTVGAVDTISAEGAAVSHDTVSGEIAYDPGNLFQGLAEGETREDDFDYVASDGNGGETPGTVEVTVVGVNDAPTASDVAISAAEDGDAVTGAYAADDIDSDDDASTLNFVITNQPSEGHVVDNGDGTFTFDPLDDFQDLAAGETRIVTFNYAAVDGHGAVSGDATGFVTVTGEDEAPTGPVTVQFGSSGIERLQDMQVDSQGNAYIVGFTNGTMAGPGNAGSNDAFLTKVGKTGEVLWTKQFGSTDTDAIRSLTIDDQDNIYFTLDSFGDILGETHQGGWDSYLVKADGDGTILGKHSLATSSHEYNMQIAWAGGNEFYVSGTVHSSINGDPFNGGTDIYVAKYQYLEPGLPGELETFGEVWSDLVGGSRSDFPNDISVDGNGDLAIAAEFEPSHGFQRAAVLRYDTDGNLDANTFVHNSYSHTFSIATIGNDSIIGIQYGFGTSGRINIKRLDENNQEIWSTDVPSGTASAPTSIDIDADGNVHMVGFANNTLNGEPTNGGYDVAHVVLDPTDGTILDSEPIGTSAADSPYANSRDSQIVFGNDGTEYIAGITYGDMTGDGNAGGSDIFLRITPPKKEGQTITGGGGNDTLYGGGGDDVFVFEDGSGHDVVGDFKAGAGSPDVLDVSAFGFADFNALLSAAEDQGGTADVTIALDDDDQVTLVGVRTADLHQGDFIL